MKILFLIAVMFFSPVFAQDTTKVSVKNEEIAENFDLKAVASAFGEAKDLEEFEKMLNDPEKQLSNLDLNEDGEVDYLRVMETVKGSTHYIAVQAVIGKDKYQDVCTIELEKDKKGEEVVQVVGDTYIYGPGYIYQPVYAAPPVIFVYFWAPVYHPWHSPWYWGYHPPYYRPWHPHPVHVYHRNVTVHVNVNVNYNRTTVRYSKNSVNIQKEQRRNDYGSAHPDKSFENRNRPANSDKKVESRPGEVKDRSSNSDKKADVKAAPTTGRKVDSDWKKSSERDAVPSTGNVNQKDKKSVQPSGKTGNKPSTQDRQSIQPSNQKLNSQPANKPKMRDKSSAGEMPRRRKR